MALTYGFNLDETGKKYTAEQFTEMFHEFGGDAVSTYGTGYKLTLTTQLSFTIGSGFAYAHGYWLKNTGSIPFTLEPAYISSDRYDAIAVVVSASTRAVYLRLLTDIDPENPTQTDDVYQYYLYTIRVTRGSTVLSSTDITDRRTSLITLSAISDIVNEVYTFSVSGIEDLISELQSKAQSAINTANTDIEALTELVDNQRSTYVGDLRDAISRPSNQWLECNGGTIPSQYTDLIALLGSTTLPILSANDPRLTVWIYAGT